jgi:hypothetical protein
MCGKSVDGACAMHRDGSIGIDWSSLVLAPLSANDAGAYDALLDRNRQYLTQHGDYRDALTALARPYSMNSDGVCRRHQRKSRQQSHAERLGFARMQDMGSYHRF